MLTKNLLTLLLCAPIHGICMLLCARDARFFDLVLLWARTRLPALFANLRVWKASSYTPLVIDLAESRREGAATNTSRATPIACGRCVAPTVTRYAALRRELTAARVFLMVRTWRPDVSDASSAITSRRFASAARASKAAMTLSSTIGTSV